MLKPALVTTALAVTFCGLSPWIIAADAVPTATKVEHPIAFSEETRVRQHLLLVSLAREPADLIIRGATVLKVQ